MYVIGVTGIVAGGKSTFANEIVAALGGEAENIQVVSTDNFLYSNEVLMERGLMQKKGFPQSHNVERLREFLTDVRQGLTENGVYSIPEYSHLQYNIIGTELLVKLQPSVIARSACTTWQSRKQSVTGLLRRLRLLATTKQEPILIIEGVGLSEVTDLLDYLIFLDTPVQIAYERYIKRALSLRKEAETTQTGYFTQFLDMSETEFIERCKTIWNEVNMANYEQNVLPLRSGADATYNNM